MPASQLQALDPVAGTRAWMVPTEQANNTPVFSTAGGLVFQGGSNDGAMHAYNAETGEAVWSFPTGSQFNQSAISYMHDGKQYIAIIASGSNTGQVNATDDAGRCRSLSSRWFDPVCLRSAGGCCRRHVVAKRKRGSGSAPEPRQSAGRSALRNSGRPLGSSRGALCLRRRLQRRHELTGSRKKGVERPSPVDAQVQKARTARRFGPDLDDLSRRRSTAPRRPHSALAPLPN